MNVSPLVVTFITICGVPDGFVKCGCFSDYTHISTQCKQTTVTVLLSRFEYAQDF